MDTIITVMSASWRLGFGTFCMQAAAAASSSPKARLAYYGHRHLDTAAMYENEDAAGAAIAAL